MSIATNIDFGFDTDCFSYMKISQFCTKILKMKHPVLSNYISDRDRICLSLIDSREDGFSFLVQFNQRSHKTDNQFDVRVILSNHASKLTVEEKINLNQYKLLFLHGIFGFPVYMYFMTSNFNIAMKRITFGARGVEGVVYHDDDSIVSNAPQNVHNIFRTIESNGYSPEIARVWLYERDDNRAIKLLQNSVDLKRYHKRLKNQYKMSRKQARRKPSRTNTTYLRKCFEHFSSDPRTASRLTNALVRYFDIYNLTDLRQHRVSVEELSIMKNIGTKSIETYQMALLWIDSLPNANQ